MALVVAAAVLAGGGTAAWVAIGSSGPEPPVAASVVAAAAPDVTTGDPGRPESAPGDPVFALPLSPPAIVLTPFGAPADRYAAGHRGVDLAAPLGTTVFAAADGTVAFAGSVAGQGVVSIRHPDGLKTTYEPVTALVRVGQVVGRGDPIGTVTAGHPSCQPAICLHWGAIAPDGSYVDPMVLLRPWRVRLLPWDG